MRYSRHCLSRRIVTVSLLCFCTSVCACADERYRDIYRGTANARISVAGADYETRWEMGIVRTPSINPYDRSGLQDAWAFDPIGSVSTTPAGKQFWIDLRCSMPEPEEILGLSPRPVPGRASTAGSIKILTAQTPVTVRAPLYPLETFNPATLSWSECPPADQWADVAINVEPRFRGPSERDRSAGFHLIHDDFDRDLPSNDYSLVRDFDRPLEAKLRGDTDGAIHLWTDFINRHSEENYPILAFDHRGRLFLKIGRSDQAIADLTRAVTPYPIYNSTYPELIRAYHAAGRDAEALPALDNAIPTVYAENARMLLAAGRETAALDTINRAIDTEQCIGSELYNLRSSIHEHSGHRRAAIADYRIAARITPRHESDDRVARGGLIRLGAPPPNPAEPLIPACAPNSNDPRPGRHPAAH
jgi:hypothetical protein